MSSFCCFVPKDRLFIHALELLLKAFFVENEGQDSWETSTRSRSERVAFSPTFINIKSVLFSYIYVSFMHM